MVKLAGTSDSWDIPGLGCSNDVLRDPPNIKFTIQWISHSKTNCAIQWIVIYPMDSFHQLLNNWVLLFSQPIESCKFCTFIENPDGIRFLGQSNSVVPILFPDSTNNMTFRSVLQKLNGAQKSWNLHTCSEENFLKILLSGKWITCTTVSSVFINTCSQSESKHYLTVHYKTLTTSYGILRNINPLTPGIKTKQILLCLMPDDFICRLGASWAARGVNTCRLTISYSRLWNIMLTYLPNRIR